MQVLLNSYGVTSDGDVARGLVLSLLAKFLYLTGVLARVLLLRLADLQCLLSALRLDEEARVTLFYLLAVLVPLDLGLGVVRLALQLQFALRLTSLLLFQLLLEAELGIGR